MVSWRFELLGQLQLGADAVGAGDQHRLAVLAGQVEQRRRSRPAAAHHFRAEGALDQRLDAFDDFVARVDIDAGVAVGHRGGAGGGWVTAAVGGRGEKRRF